MGRLDELDLTLRLAGRSRTSGSRPAAAPPAAAPRVRRPHRRRRPRAAGVPRVRGLGRLGQGRRDQAPRRRRSTRVTCASRSSPRRRPTRSATTSSGASGPRCPGWGGMAVFDRSWYGRVLVERVEGFATEEEWRRAYGEIAGFERSLVAEGMILVKFWLHISAEEQLGASRRAQGDPLKALEAHRRGLAQPRASVPPTRRRSRRCSTRPTSPTRRGTCRGRLQALGAHPVMDDDDRARSRARDAPMARARRCPATPL